MLELHSCFIADGGKERWARAGFITFLWRGRRYDPGFDGLSPSWPVRGGLYGGRPHDYWAMTCCRGQTKGRHHTLWTTAPLTLALTNTLLLLSDYTPTGGMTPPLWLSNVLCYWLSGFRLTSTVSWVLSSFPLGVFLERLSNSVRCRAMWWPGLGSNGLYTKKVNVIRYVTSKNMVIRLQTVLKK